MKSFSGPPADCMATIYDYGNGLVEGSWHSIRDVVRQQPQEKAKRGESENREQNEFFAIRRARTKLRRLVLTLRPTSYLAWYHDIPRERHRSQGGMAGNG